MMFSDVLDMIDGMSVITTAFRTDKKEEKKYEEKERRDSEEYAFPEDIIHAKEERLSSRVLATT